MRRKIGSWLIGAGRRLVGTNESQHDATTRGTESGGSEPIVVKSVESGEVEYITTPAAVDRNHLIEADKLRIMQIVEPSIYITHHSQLTIGSHGAEGNEQYELNRFLKEHTLTGGAKQPYFFDGYNDAGEVDSTLTPYDLDNIPELAGRVCYMSFDKPRPGGNGAYLAHIRETGHGSVLEHASISVVLTGVSRSLTHELVRHRAGFGYSQLSQRFVDHDPTGYGGTLGGPSQKIEGHWSFICPLALMRKGMDKARGVWFQHMCDSVKAYELLGEAITEGNDAINDSGVSGNHPGIKKLTLKEQREAQRSVLPNSTETKIFVTCNFRALRHLFHMRGSIHADREIRRFARRLFDKIKDLDISKELLADVTVSDTENDVLTVGYPHI